MERGNVKRKIAKMEDSKAYHIKVGGAIREVTPANGKFFTYEEMVDYVGKKPITIVPLPSGKVLIADDEGKLRKNVKVNETASQIWQEEYPRREYPLNNDQTIVGNVLICPREMAR